MIEVVFTKGPIAPFFSARRYRSVLTRADGAVVELHGGSWNRVGGPAGEIPHDLAHLVVEDELGLERGVYGTLVAGGLFEGASFVGAKPPHGEQRGREITAGVVEELNQAEVVVRAVADLALSGAAPDPQAFARACGERYAVAATREHLARCVERLHRHGGEWRALGAEQELTLGFRAAPARRGGGRPRGRSPQARAGT